MTSSMLRITFFGSVLMVAANDAYAQSDEELLETIRALRTETFLEQVANTLPESFLSSGLAPSDKERLVRQLADEYLACFEDAAVAYAELAGLSLSDFITSDGGAEFDGDSGAEFEQLYVTCIQAARQAAGISGE